MRSSRVFWILAVTTAAATAAAGASGCASERVSGAAATEATLPAVAVVRADSGTLNDVAVYAVPNTGGWYDFGFLLGASCWAGGGGAAAKRK